MRRFAVWIGEAVRFVGRMIVRVLALVVLVPTFYFGAAVLAPAPEMVHIVSE